MTSIIDLKDNFELAIQRSTEVLNQGGVIVFPTDTVYGLASRYDNENSIHRIYEIKGRDQTKALAVLIGDLNQLRIVAEDIPEIALTLGEHLWPGALTLVVKKNMQIGTPLSMDNSIGVRIPDDRFVQELAKIVGPLATTSANLSGYPSATNTEDVMDQIGNMVDLVINGGESRGGVPSTVVDCREVPVRILREGAITKQLIESYERS